MHIALGTPMFAAQCSQIFNVAVGGLQQALQRDGHRLTPLYVGNESLIHRARNAIVWRFENTPDLGDATHLLWVDGDQGFRVADVARMLGADKPVIAAPVPMKRINWQRVAKAVRDGVPAEDLERYSGYFNVVMTPGQQTLSAGEPFVIERGGTGMMLVRRDVFEALTPHVQTYANKNNGSAVPYGARIKHFHPTGIVDDDLRSEDYGFCDLAKAAGFDIWCAPWCEVGHVGAYVFRGTFKDCYRTEPT